MTMALYMITIVIVKARGIIHIAFRVHALSNVIKMLATPQTLSTFSRVTKTAMMSLLIR